jgi:hypothetical protein
MTERAIRLIHKLDRTVVLKDKTQLSDLFKKYNISDFERIIEFQINFGGLVFKAGLEPVSWGVHHLAPRGEFKYYGQEIIDFYLPNEYPEFSLLCADTLCQVRWTIDKTGAIFEDFDILTTSFEKMIEDYALWEEIIDKKEIEVIERDIYEKNLDEVLLNLENVIPIDEIQEPGIKWFKFQSDCMLLERNKELIIFGPNHYDEKQRTEIIERIK